MRRTRHVVLPVRSWQYVGLMVVSLACLTLGLISRDRGGRSGSLGGSELMHTAPHEVDACPNEHPFGPVFPYDEPAHEKGSYDYPDHNGALSGEGSGKVSLPNDRSIGNDDETRSGVRVDNSDSRTRSRILQVREKPNLLLREKRNTLDSSRSGRTDRRSRESSRSRERLSDRTHGLKLFDSRERASSMVRREASDRYRRSSSMDRRNRETTVLRDVSSQRQRLTTQERRTNDERRDDRVARSRSIENQSLDRHRSRSAARRAVRSIRDNRNDQSSRTSWLYDDRSGQRIENRRSNEQLRALVPENQRRFDSTKGRSSEMNRVGVRRSGVRSQGRSVIEQRELNQREDFDRVDARRMGSQGRRISRSERQKKEANTRAPTDRRSPRHNSDRVDASRMRVRSEDRRSSATRVNGDRAWIDSLRRDVRTTRNSEIRGYPERMARSASRDVSRERQMTPINRYGRRQTLSTRTLPKTEQSERREGLATRHVSEGRRQDASERSLARERRTSNEERRTSTLRELPQASRRNTEQERRTETQRVVRILDSGRSGRLTVRKVSHQRLGRSTDRALTRELATSRERRETSNLRDSRQTSERNSLQRDVPLSRVSRITSLERLGRSANRGLAQELRSSEERRETSNLRDSRRTTERSSQHRDVPVTRGSRITRSERLGRSVDRVLARELRTSGERRETSNSRDSRRTSERNPLQHDARRTRVSRIASTDRHEHLQIRNLAQDRRDRKTERLTARNLQTSGERRETSTVRRERDQASRLNSVLRNTRNSRTSRNPDIEARERDVPQGRRGPSSEESITAHLRISRQQNGVNSRSERRATEETRLARNAKNRQILNEHSRTSFRTMPDFANIKKPSNVKTNDYLHQALVLALCAIYGASLLRGKGGFYSFRNIVNPANRFVSW